MSIDKIIVTGIGFAVALFVYWFFLGKKEKAVQIQKVAEITVDGGYRPQVIEIPKGKTTILKFKRIDPSSCLEELLIPDFKIRRELPLKEIVSVEITPHKVGEFTYSCGMNMYHGKIVVK